MTKFTRRSFLAIAAGWTACMVTAASAMSTRESLEQLEDPQRRPDYDPVGRVDAASELGRRVESVTVNGVKQPMCYLADDRAGYAMCWRKRTDGKPPDSVMLNGDVRFHWKRDGPRARNVERIT